MQRKVPLPGKTFARCILRRRFAGHFGCMARIFCQSQPVFGCMARESCRELAIFPPEATFGMHGAQNLPRTAARERTAAESCHGKALGNASRENIATASQAKSASGRNPATVGRWGGDAPRENIATTSRPVAQRSPREGMGSVPWLCCGVRRATLSVRGSGHSAFSGLNCWERLRVCAVSVGNHEPASRSAKLCRIMC